MDKSMKNFMRLRRLDDVLVWDLIGDGINSVEFDIHLRSVKAIKNIKKLYINIMHLSEINNDTLIKFRKMKSVLAEKVISFVNVNPIQNCILNMFEIDKIFQIYMNKMDAKEAKKPVVNRRFRVV